MDFNEFTQLLKGLENEKLRQAFLHVTSNKREPKITPQEFETLLVNTLSHRNLNELPPTIRTNLQRYVDSEVSYAQLIAFYNIIHSLDRVREAILLASDEKRYPQVTCASITCLFSALAHSQNAVCSISSFFLRSEKEFLRTARRLPLAEFTPIEAAIVFKIFDTDRVPL